MSDYEEVSPRLIVKRWKEDNEEEAWYYTKRTNRNISQKEEVDVPRTDASEIHHSRVIGYAEVESHGHIQTGNKRDIERLLENVKEHSEWFRTFADRLTEEESEKVREVLRND